MRYLFLSFVFLSAGLLGAAAIAGEKDGKKGDGEGRSEMREKMLKEFDKDGDGKLNEGEREKAREKMQELRGGKAGERGEGRRREERRGEEGRREERRREGRDDEARRGPEGHRDGPPKLPKPEELFSKFDKDNDEKLSKDEFKALAEFVHEHMPPPPGRGPEGPPPGRGPLGQRFGGFEGPGPDGPRFREGEGPRFREGDGPGRRFRGPDGPPGPPRDGEGPGPRFRRPDGPPPRDGEGSRGDGPPRGERRSFEREGRRGPPPRDRDDDDRRPGKYDRGDEKGGKDKVEAAV